MKFVEKIKAKKAKNRFDVENDIEGIFTGRYVENFLGTGRDLPIWVASYVLYDYGTGAVNCSAHDERDFAFAKKYDIPLRGVLVPPDGDDSETEKIRKGELFYRQPDGILEEPREFAGRRWDEVRADIINDLAKKGLVEKKVNYKIRDWVFSRQRYWGEPIPLIHCEKCGIVPVPEKELPVTLPKVKSYEPTGTGESPLADISKWVNVSCPKCGGKAKRETNTMPQWAGSSWYYLRYIDPHNKKALVDKKKDAYWSPVDMYVGGTEHATRHLIYARFWHKFLYDIGVVNYDEPFKQLKNQGLISGSDGRKMSKRWGNVINPDDVVASHGADTLRVYEMFMGPFEQGAAWSTESMMGARRFLDKVWRIAQKADKGQLPEKSDSLLQRAIKKVGEDINNFGFNTAISTMMVLANDLDNLEVVPIKSLEAFLKILAPLAPHLTEELWHNLGHKKSVHVEKWPVFDESKLRDKTVNIVVQINGKVRDSFAVTAGSGQKEVEEQAFTREIVKKWTDGQTIRKIIYVPDRILNIVV